MEYTFSKTEVSKEKIQSYSELLTEVFTETKKYTPAFLDWQYNQNPSGKVVGYDAYYDGKLIAHYVALPTEYFYNGQIVKGILALNVATHNDHRGKGLFTKLAAMTYDYAAELGYKFVTGVANQNTTDGYLKRLGFKVVAPLDVYIFPGKLSSANDPVNYFREAWDEKKVQWRVNNPETKYFKNKQAVTSRTHIGFIDAILSERKEFAGVALSNKGSIFKMAIGLNMKNFERGVKFRLPDKLKPSPLNLIFKTLGGYEMKVDKNTTFFELTDFDAY
ncbi:MAG: hypothetical protein K0S32_2769 [Bacteroidetes bacterium]|jgi:GNAT superfamily N-acetyltransferase|nr:hypothetical protein [Bacteroidota bacterium]